MLQHVGKGVVAVCLLLAVAVGVQAGHKPLTKEEQQKVNQAIDRGIDYLKRAQAKNGSWTAVHGRRIYDPTGHTLVPLLALLESDVPANDPAVQKGIRWVRARLPELKSTYEISLALLVLDRLGDAKDKKMIESLALRLVAGQCRTGGWSYRCLILGSDGENQLLIWLRQPGKKGAIPASLRLLTVVQDPRTLVWQDPTGEGNKEFKPILGVTDNSNTQFALLGLWAAQRHGIPIDRTLRVAVQRFETSQNADGSWSYGYQFGGGIQPARSRAMTAVGLLAFAIAEGLESFTNESSGPPRDRRILSAFASLAQEIGTPSGQMKRRLPCQDLYFLWSVERIGMLYNLELIGNRDWYRWGAEILVTNQAREGYWPEWELGPKDSHSTYLPTINTSFALLFLKRSSQLKDLSAKLPFKPGDLNETIAGAIENPQRITVLCANDSQLSPNRGWIRC